MVAAAPVEANEQWVPEHVNANIRTIAAVGARVRRTATRPQRMVESAISAIARPAMIAVILGLSASWGLYNFAAPHAGLSQADPPPFFWLQGLLGLYATVVSTMVLTGQRRQTHEAEQRAQLELQVNLLAEQKTTKIVALLEELRRDLPLVSNRDDPVAAALQQEVDPHAVLSALETTLETALENYEAHELVSPDTPERPSDFATPHPSRTARSITSKRSLP